MPTGRHSRCLLVAPAMLLAAAASVPAASAQTLWDWGGDNNVVAGSGRQTVRFSPNYQPGQLIVSFGDRVLYHVTRPGEAVSYPIAIPREQSRWQGVMTVTQKRINPSWTPTPEMRAENPRLPSWVPGGHPMNPLGVRGLYLGTSTYRIHGTDAPWTIGQPVSKGCIRMYNQDVIDLYDRVPVGTKVTVTWNSFKGGAVIAGGPATTNGRQLEAQRAPQRQLARMQDDDQVMPGYSGFYFDDRSDAPRSRWEEQRRREARAPDRDRAVQSSVSVSAASVPPPEMRRPEPKAKPAVAGNRAAAGEPASYRIDDDQPYSVDRKSDGAARAVKSKARAKDVDAAEAPAEPRVNRDKRLPARAKETDTAAAANTPSGVEKRLNALKERVSRQTDTARTAALTEGSSEQSAASATRTSPRKPLRRARAIGAADGAAMASSPASTAAAPLEVTPD